jgi:iron-sulfur cluster repair protein YtfE (RIC family)
MREPIGKDACELLDADHLAVKHLFVEYARLTYAADTKAAGARTAIATKICDELTAHAQIEEEIFYPALRKAVPRAADVVDEAEEEHQRAKNLIARIRDIGTADAQMDQLVADLARAVEDHVKEERDELFPKARSAAGLDLAALGLELLQRQQQLAQEPGRV